MARMMKDSAVPWIGSIPCNWDMCRIKTVADIYTGNSIKDEEKELYEDSVDAIPYVATKDVDATLQTINYDNGMYVKNTDTSFKRAPSGSTLLCIEGGSAGRKIAYTSQNVCFVNKLCCFRPTNAYGRYLYYFLMSPAFTQPFRSRISGLIGGVSVNELNNFGFLLPPYSEQRAIADFLDTECARIDSIIEQTRVSIEEYKKLKQSVITQAVTKGIRPGRKMKDSGIEWIGWIPEEWEVKKTKHIAKAITKGNGISKEDVAEDGDIQCVRYGEIYTKYNGAFTCTFSTTNEDAIVAPKRIFTGDILFAGTGELVEEIGKNIVYMGAEPCLAGGDIIVMSHSQNPIFLNYALNSSYSQVQKSRDKTKLKVVHISASDIGSIMIALPQLDEQAQIGKYLDEMCTEIDNVITAKHSLITDMVVYKKSLIYEYVTGKKEVPA